MKTWGAKMKLSDQKIAGRWIDFVFGANRIATETIVDLFCLPLYFSLRLRQLYLDLRCVFLLDKLARAKIVLDRLSRIVRLNELGAKCRHQGESGASECYECWRRRDEADNARAVHVISGFFIERLN